ncbi:hypothetical protein BJX64DRAFT_149217 [Aspergillus heterothallicus]
MNKPKDVSGSSEPLKSFKFRALDNPRQVITPPGPLLATGTLAYREDAAGLGKKKRIPRRQGSKMCQCVFIALPTNYNDITRLFSGGGARTVLLPSVWARRHSRGGTAWGASDGVSSIYKTPSLGRNSTDTCLSCCLVLCKTRTIRSTEAHIL